MDIPEDLLREAKAQSGASTNRKAVVIALSEYVRRKKLKEAIHLLGSFTELSKTDSVRKQRKKRTW